ncbi:MAG: helix-turn-helix domain-containing protein [Gemmatimonadales bacterium]
MLILAAVPLNRLQRLRAADPERYELLPLATWGEMIETIRLRPVEMAVVDPLWGEHPRVREVERLRLLFPSLPLLIYTSLEPETAGVLLDLGRVGIRRVIFARFDDSPAALRLTLRRELEETASRKVVVTLMALLEGLPPQLRWAVESMLYAPADTVTVSALADRAQLERRTCERWFARSGLPSPRAILILARTLYAHRLLMDPGYTVDDVAAKLGYRKARSLQVHLKEVFGYTAGELRISLTPEEALQIVTKRYFPRFSKVAS